MAEIAGCVMLQRVAVAVRAFRKVLIEVNSAADKTLRTAIRILTFRFARWLPASPNLLVRSNQSCDLEYCENPWLHDAFLIS